MIECLKFYITHLLGISVKQNVLQADFSHILSGAYLAHVDAHFTKMSNMPLSAYCKCLFVFLSFILLKEVYLSGIFNTFLKIL